MFNVAVIRLKDLIRFIFLGISILVIIVLCKKSFNKKNFEKINIGQKFSNNMSEYVKRAVNTELPEIAKEKEKTEENEANDKKENKLLKAIIGLELGVVNAKEKVVENIETSNEIGQSTDSKQKSEKETDGKRKKTKMIIIIKPEKQQTMNQNQSWNLQKKIKKRK